MTKEITKAIILQQLQDRFKLRDYLPTKFLFDETVVPVYDLSQELIYGTADYKQLSVTSTGAYDFFTVPQNERWHLNTYNVVFMATGAYKVSGAFVTRVVQETPSSWVYLDMTKNQTVSYAVNLPKPFTLDPGDMLRVNVDDYTSTAALRLYIDFMKEYIR